MQSGIYILIPSLMSGVKMMDTIGMLLPAVTVQKKAVMVNMYMGQQEIQDMSALPVIIQIK